MIKIIKAEERHISDICRLWRDFMQFSEDIDPIFTPREGTLQITEEKYLRPALKAENSLVLVALDGEKVVGYSYSLIIDPSDAWKRKKYGNIHDLFITAGYRRQGIGEKIYIEILKWFHAEGIDRIELQVIARNQAAYSFWKKHGFTDFQNTLCRSI
jgi:ribosomal protein S18 acetylase RimI-like enzyme